MKLMYLAFTAKGKALADALAAALGGSAMRCNQPLNLAAWTKAAFAGADGLVFVGAAGIAVRAVAPCLQSKAADPAVVVVDECGRYAVPILSGHLGGANALARRIAGACGAIPVLTTATDANGVFAVDEWAKRQGCAILDVQRVKAVSAALLAGGTVRVKSAWPVLGEPPPGLTLAAENEDAEVLLDLHQKDTAALRLVPKIAVLGVGCKRGTARQALEQALQALLAGTGMCAQAICCVASIDLKQEEPGLLAFCKAHGWALHTYTAARLQSVPGRFTPSAFVQKVTGVDNVCERSAVLAAGGALYQGKQAGGGVTMAVALKPYQPDWRWQDA